MEKIYKFKFREFDNPESTRFPLVSTGQSFKVSPFKKQLEYWKNNVKPSHLPKPSFSKHFELEILEN